jgi:hypothetical protein
MGRSGKGFRYGPVGSVQPGGQALAQSTESRAAC